MSASRIIRLHDGTPVTVDADDYERLSRYRWSKNGNGYARTGSNSRLMHRLIMHAPKGKVVDHINGDIYDNRKRNLRVCCQRENAKNHRRKCVQLDRRYGTWRAAIKVDYVTRYLGSYATEAQATEAYERAARYYFGAFANQAIAHAQPKCADELRHEARMRSGFRGIKRSASLRNPYAARIRIAGRERHLGVFPTEEAAARAFDRAARRLGYPGWKLNFPEEATA